MSLAGDCSEIEKPGQFIDIIIDDFFLRRPISIFDHDNEHVEILYRVVGGGTDALAAKVPGDVLDVLLPLGNGFDLSKIFTPDQTTPGSSSESNSRVLLVAGGIGMPPIHELAKQFKAGNPAEPHVNFRVLLGFRSADDMFGLDSFRALGVEPVVATEDGSFGIKGTVTDAMDMMKGGAVNDNKYSETSVTADKLDFDYDYVFCCGPEPMLRAVYDHSPDGQFSFEERMGCGFGACMGCTCKTKYGYKRICRDGPVLYHDEIVW